jgi:hypothetical protein
MARNDSPSPPLTVEVGADGSLTSGGHPITALDLSRLILDLQRAGELTVVAKAVTGPAPVTQEMLDSHHRSGPSQPPVQADE